jgi:hypothetical protein
MRRKHPKIQAEHDAAVALMSGKAADPFQPEALFIKPDDLFESQPAPVPHGDSLLVFYIQDQQEVIRISTKLKQMGSSDSHLYAACIHQDDPPAVRIFDGHAFFFPVRKIKADGI